MARKKRSGGGGPGSGDWLNTYADMVTLLLTFFILLFSMSSLDAAKFNMLVTAFASDGESSDVIVIRGDATGREQTGSTPTTSDGDPTEIIDLEDIFRALKERVEAEGQSSSVSVSKGEDYVFIQFMDNMLFEPNSAILRSESRGLLGFVGESIKALQEDAYSVNIVGHTAAIPDDPNYPVSDRDLSTNRANAVLKYFEDDIGVRGDKLFATGLGKWKPIADNETEEGRGKNRRVEIMISSENNSLSEQLDNAYEKLVK